MHNKGTLEDQAFEKLTTQGTSDERGTVVQASRQV